MLELFREPEPLHLFIGSRPEPESRTGPFLEGAGEKTGRISNTDINIKSKIENFPNLTVQ